MFSILKNIINLIRCLISKEHVFSARPWEIDRVESIDYFDSCGSKVYVTLRIYFWIMLNLFIKLSKLLVLVYSLVWGVFLFFESLQSLSFLHMEFLICGDQFEYILNQIQINSKYISIVFSLICLFIFSLYFILNNLNQILKTDIESSFFDNFRMLNILLCVLFFCSFITTMYNYFYDDNITYSIIYYLFFMLFLCFLFMNINAYILYKKHKIELVIIKYFSNVLDFKNTYILIQLFIKLLNFVIYPMCIIKVLLNIYYIFFYVGSFPELPFFLYVLYINVLTWVSVFLYSQVNILFNIILKEFVNTFFKNVVKNYNVVFSLQMKYRFNKFFFIYLCFILIFMIVLYTFCSFTLQVVNAQTIDGYYSFQPDYSKIALCLSLLCSGSLIYYAFRAKVQIKELNEDFESAKEKLRRLENIVDIQNKEIVVLKRKCDVEQFLHYRVRADFNLVFTAFHKYYHGYYYTSAFFDNFMKTYKCMKPKAVFTTTEVLELLKLRHDSLVLPFHLDESVKHRMFLLGFKESGLSKQLYKDAPYNLRISCKEPISGIGEFNATLRSNMFEQLLIYKPGTNRVNMPSNSKSSLSAEEFDSIISLLQKFM